MAVQMNILALPSEILLDILEQSLPYGFESLSLTCKRFYNLSRRLIPRHNSYRKKYRSFHLGTETVETVKELLNDIAADPIIAEYIVHANLGGRSSLDDDDRPYTFPDGVPDAFSTLVTGSKHLAALNSDPGFSRDWLENIVEYTTLSNDDVDFPAAFLLTLLPNVESLALPREWHIATATGDHTKVWHRETLNATNKSASALVSLLVMRANDPNMSYQPLQKLHTINPTENIDTEYETHMEMIFPFLALKSLRKVWHNAAQYKPSNDAYAAGHCAEFPTLGINVESMTLDDYAVSGKGARVLFKDMHSLRELNLEYITKEEIGASFNGMEFLHHLQRQVGRCLEKLVFRFEDMSVYNTAVKSPLLGFKVLKHLEIDVALFVDNEPSADRYDFSDYEDDDDQDQGENEGEQDGQENEAVGQNGLPVIADYDMREYWGDLDIRERVFLRLIKHFPPSLETLVLNARARKRDCRFLEALFKRFDDRREASLPLLKTLRVNMTAVNNRYRNLEDYQTYVDRAANLFSRHPFVTFLPGQCSGF
ncbi:hypothetical protein K4F52_003319 [Lecanicillium sp. MT-2017a]|nr:hypothetical protein K4F52_003319 [Lecanicillium sp. MT-2017a]